MSIKKTHLKLFFLLKKYLFLQVLLAVICGTILGVFTPHFATNFEVIPILFIRLIKIVITPLVFASIVLGVCAQKGQANIGKLALRTLIYFEIMSLAAVLVTFAFMMFLHPGTGFNITAFRSIDIGKFKLNSPHNTSLQDFLIHMVPDNLFATLSGDNLIAVIILAVIFSLAILKIADNSKIIDFFSTLNQVLFKVISLISKISPLAAFAAIAATVGHEGIHALTMLVNFILVLCLSMVAFIVILFVLAKFYHFSPFKLMKHIKDELIIAYGTSSSESVFPQLMQKLESFGCAKQIVGFVLPAGYAFNLVGTAIYVTGGVFFIQQAYNIPITGTEIIAVIGTILIVSKGAAGIAGAGFVTLSAIISALPNHMIPIEGLALLLGIDRFMSDIRTITNIIGNSIGTVIIAKAENSFKD